MLLQVPQLLLPMTLGGRCDNSIHVMARETPSFGKATLLVQGQEEETVVDGDVRDVTGSWRSALPIG